MEQQQLRMKLYRKSPKHHNRLNRELLESNRQKKRNELHQNLRKMSPSPEPHRSGEDKINENVPGNTSTVIIHSQTKLIITARDPEKVKKAQAFHQRLIEYKEKKAALLQEKKANTKRPFVSAVNSSSGFGGKGATNGSGMGSKGAVPKKKSSEVPTTAQSSFVPNGHTGFTPPEGLKYQGENEKDKSKSRLSVYTIVPTPPKKPKPANGFSSTQKALPANLPAKKPKTKPSAINIERAPLIIIQMEDLRTPRESTNKNQALFVTSTQEEVIDLDNYKEFESGDENSSDPDWAKTPRFRRKRPVSQQEGTTNEAHESNNKRKSKGCKCRGNCGNKRCGCNLLDQKCSINCLCTAECTNRKGHHHVAIKMHKS